MYDLKIKPEADKIFRELAKKDSKQLGIIQDKIKYIRENPFKSYKHLSSPLQGFLRVHIDSHFVLIFQIHHDNSTVEIFYYDHHDNVYEWRPSVEE